jgi:hypothetical protein
MDDMSVRGDVAKKLWTGNRTVYRRDSQVTAVCPGSGRMAQLNPNHMARIIFVPLLFVLTLAVPSARGQSAIASVGIAIPTGGLGARRGAGPIARFGGEWRPPVSAVNFRLEAELASMLGSPGGSNGSSTGDLKSFAGLATVVVGSSGQRRGYATLSIAAQSLSVRGANNPYGTTPGLRAGFGFRMPAGKRWLVIEAARHLNVTDFATGRDFEAGTFNLITAGLRF